MKLQSHFLFSTPAFLTAVRIGTGAGGSGSAYASSSQVFTTNLRDPSTSTNFYFVRQTTNSYVYSPSSPYKQADSCEQEYFTGDFQLESNYLNGLNHHSSVWRLNHSCWSREQDNCDKLCVRLVETSVHDWRGAVIHSSITAIDSLALSPLSRYSLGLLWTE